MSFKDTLLVLTSYPEPTLRKSVEQAVALGAALGTRMSAISFEIDVKVPGGSNFLADTLLNLPGLIAAEKQKAAANARDLLDAFEAAAKQRGILGERILERCLTALVPDLLVDHARLRDLTIIPVRDGESIEHWHAESVVFGSGRPCMILPDPTRPAMNGRQRSKMSRSLGTLAGPRRVQSRMRFRSYSKQNLCMPLPSPTRNQSRQRAPANSLPHT